MFQNRNLFFDEIPFISQRNNLCAPWICSVLDLQPHLLPDAFALRLKGASLFLKLPLLLEYHLKFCEINGMAPSPDLPGNGNRVVSDETLIDHGSACDSAGSLWQSVQSTWPTITAATAEKTVIPRAVNGFCPCATATVVITPAPRQATQS